MSFQGKRSNIDRPRKRPKKPVDLQVSLFPYRPSVINEYRGKSVAAPEGEKIHPNMKDLTGRRFGELFVIKDSGKRSPNREVIWVCECDCGLPVLRIASALVSGKTLSCGHRRNTVEVVRKRGLAQRKPNAAFRREWSHYRTMAKQRGILFTLSFEDFMRIVSLCCSYCGGIPSRLKKSGAGHDTALMNGVDRYDNSVGYTPANSVPCCRRCNLMKHMMTAGDFISHVRDIVDFQSVLAFRLTGGVPFLLQA